VSAKYPCGQPREGLCGVELGAVRLPSSPESAATARRFVRLIVTSWQVLHVADSAELLVSELVSNAVLHANGRQGSTLRVQAVREHQRLRVEVHDSSRRLPSMRSSHLFDESGRGLVLVAGIADRHGAYPTAFGKSVWYELIAWPPYDATVY
jgi:anti-sigma regulatory factor (Ser/Thr protein kinase)